MYATRPYTKRQKHYLDEDEYDEEEDENDDDRFFTRNLAKPGIRSKSHYSKAVTQFP
jgi:hypothetical protein